MQGSFTKPPDLQTWKDIAFSVGLTDEDAQLSYANFQANDWCRGNGIELKSWNQIHGLLCYWRNNRQNFQKKKIESAYDQVERLKAEGEL